MKRQKERNRAGYWTESFYSGNVFSIQGGGNQDAEDTIQECNEASGRTVSPYNKNSKSRSIVTGFFLGVMMDKKNVFAGS